MRASEAFGVVLLVAGLLLLYFLRHLLVQVVVVILGLAGLVIALLLITVGLALMFGVKRRFKRFVVSV